MIASSRASTAARIDRSPARPLANERVFRFPAPFAAPAGWRAPLIALLMLLVVLVVTVIMTPLFLLM